MIKQIYGYSFRLRFQQVTPYYTVMIMYILGLFATKEKCDISLHIILVI